MQEVNRYDGVRWVPVPAHAKTRGASLRRALTRRDHTPEHATAGELAARRDSEDIAFRAAARTRVTF
jgi:hypothetical protein